MRLATSILAAFALAGLAGAAQAQLEPQPLTGSRIAVDPIPLEKQRAGEVHKRFAACMYRNAPDKAAALLTHSDLATVDMAGAAIGDVKKTFNMEHCLGLQAGMSELLLGMRFSNETLRDMMAEEAYLAKNPAAPSLPASSTPPPPLQNTYVSSGDKLTIAQGMAEFTDCAVLRDPRGADALLRTMPASEEERAAASALAPSLGACLFEGQSVSLTPASIRGFMAYAMWNRFARGAGQ